MYRVVKYSVPSADQGLSRRTPGKGLERFEIHNIYYVQHMYGVLRIKIGIIRICIFSFLFWLFSLFFLFIRLFKSFVDRNQIFTN
jgi:hypothetical protein